MTHRLVSAPRTLSEPVAPNDKSITLRDGGFLPRTASAYEGKWMGLDRHLGYSQLTGAAKLTGRGDRPRRMVE